MCKCSVASVLASWAASSRPLTRISAPNDSSDWRARSPRWMRGQLLFQFRGHGVQRRFAPRDQDTRAGRMFGLGDHVGGDEIGPRRFVGQHDTSLGPAIESMSTSP